MEIKELINDGLMIRLALHFAKEDYADKKKKVLNKFRRNAEIRGFRKGMAPMSLIEKLHGGEALVESLNELISENLNKYVEDNKLAVIGEPLPVEDAEKKNDLAAGEDFDFSFDIALAPKFEMNLSAEDKIPYYNVKIDDKEKEEYKKGIFRQFAKLEACEVAKDEDFVIADMTQGDRKSESTYISIPVLSEDAKAQFIGKKAGDEFDVDVVKTFPNEADRAALLRIKKEELAETEPVWHVSVREVKTYVNAEPGQELYDQLFGKDKVKTVEEFDAAVIERMNSEFKNESEYRFMLDVREYLMNKAAIVLPEDFLKRWLFQINEGKFSMEDIEKDFPLFVKDFKWQTISNRIMADNKLEVKNEDVMEQAKRLAQYQFAMYGIPSVPEDHLAQFTDMILKDEKQARRVYEKAEENVVLEFVRNTVTLENKEISVEDLRNMNNQ